MGEDRRRSDEGCIYQALPINAFRHYVLALKFLQFGDELAVPPNPFLLDHRCVHETGGTIGLSTAKRLPPEPSAHLQRRDSHRSSRVRVVLCLNKFPGCANTLADIELRTLALGLVTY